MARRSHAERQEARRRSTCRACRADGADIGVFDHGVPHTGAADCDAVDILCQHGDMRVGNHVFHVREKEGTV